MSLKKRGVGPFLLLIAIGAKKRTEFWVRDGSFFEKMWQLGRMEHVKNNRGFRGWRGYQRNEVAGKPATNPRYLRHPRSLLSLIRWVRVIRGISALVGAFGRAVSSALLRLR
jgi:hypothetical protein